MHLYLQDSFSEVAQSCSTLCNTMDCSFQAPPSMEFSRQEYWSGLPFEEIWNTERGNWSALWVHLELMKTYLKPKLNNQIKTTEKKKNPFPFYCKLMIEIHTNWWTVSECLLVSRSISFQWPFFVHFSQTLFLLIKILLNIFCQKHLSRSN